MFDVFFSYETSAGTNMSINSISWTFFKNYLLLTDGNIIHQPGMLRRMRGSGTRIKSSQTCAPPFFDHERRKLIAWSAQGRWKGVTRPHGWKGYVMKSTEKVGFSREIHTIL